MTESAQLEAARQKMIANRFGKADMSHGKGTARRKKKVKGRSSAAQSDAKLTSVINKLGATQIPGIEEVNFFKEDGTVQQFVNPKVQASLAANTYVISGPNKTKQLQEMLPGIVSQLGMDQEISRLQQQQASIPEGDEDDEDVPDLVDGNFEEVAEK